MLAGVPLPTSPKQGCHAPSLPPRRVALRRAGVVRHTAPLTPRARVAERPAQIRESFFIPSQIASRPRSLGTFGPKPRENGPTSESDEEIIPALPGENANNHREGVKRVRCCATSTQPTKIDQNSDAAEFIAFSFSFPARERTMTRNENDQAYANSSRTAFPLPLSVT
jgi:hypothetical protein